MHANEWSAVQRPPILIYQIMASDGKWKKKISICLSQIRGSVLPAEDKEAKKCNSESYCCLLGNSVFGLHQLITLTTFKHPLLTLGKKE